MAVVFVSYRWTQGSAEARLLYDALTADLVNAGFGPRPVAMHVMDFRPGYAIPSESLQLIGQADVVLCVIDSQWLAPSEDDPDRRGFIAPERPRPHRAGACHQRRDPGP